MVPRFIYPCLLACGLALAMPAPVAAQSADAAGGRELAAIREEQALLRRQLTRLEETMRVLLSRLESEGRTRTVDLLEQGLQQLEERRLEAKNLEEWMGTSEASLEQGQLMQAVEQQSRTVEELEALLTTLLDRRAPDEVEEELDRLRALRRGIEDAATAEAELEQRTRELEEQSRTEAQEALDQGLAELAAAQLEQTEAAQRSARSGLDADLEWLEGELDRLTERQRTDAEVLEQLDAAEGDALEVVAAALRAAQAAGGRAARAESAARQLERAAEDLARRPGEAERVAQELSEAAQGQRMAAETAATDADRAAAEAAAEALERAASQGAEWTRESAAALRELAEGERASARAERDRARDSLGESIDERGLAGESRRALEALIETAQEAERAARNAATDEEREALIGEADRLVEQARSEAARAASGLERLRDSIRRSQERQAEEINGLERALESLEQRTPSGDQVERALSELARAAGAAQQASRALDPDEPLSAESPAREALDSLERASDALRALRSAGEASDGDRRAAEQQRALAESARRLESSLEGSNLDGEARERVRSALEDAADAMDRAAEQLAEGRPAAAGAPQQEARSALERAQDESRAGRRPTRPEDRQRAQELAEAQRALTERLLELESLDRERDQGRPNQDLAQAGEAMRRASEALEQGDLDRAQQEERRARAELEQAAEELEAREREYEQLRQEELLFRIGEECRELAEAHAEQLAQTIEIDGNRERGSAPGRADRLRLRRVAREEQGLAERAGEMAAELEAEASFVFAEILRQVEIDLSTVAREMDEAGGYQSDRRVQGLQRDVAERLQWLIDALEQELERRDREQRQSEQGDQQQQQQGQSGQEQLVPDDAELRLLRRLEIEVQAGVAELRLLYPELEEGGEVDPLVFEDIARLATRHERLTRLFGSFRESVGLPDPDEAEDPEIPTDEER
jgi:hypothetical protein